MLTSCLEDNINVPVEGEIKNGARVLGYFEANGDYINTDAPSLVSAEEVYSALSQKESYLIIDVRDSVDFVNGHIKGAVNISNTELLDYMNNWYNQYYKIVIVSKNGQSAAYYTCLLRLYGFNNVYSLNFGMAYWNIDFADVWLDRLNDSRNLSKYNNNKYTKNSYTNLPDIGEKINKNGGQLAKERIASFITKGFVDKIDSVTVLSSGTNFNDLNIGNEFYLICYAAQDLYIYPPKYGTTGHPPNAIHYYEYASLRSINELQTLPTNRKILIYDYNGQMSAEVTAYLLVMGYQAKSLLFGGCTLFYNSFMLPFLHDHAFLLDEISNFPYVVGK